MPVHNCLPRCLRKDPGKLSSLNQALGVELGVQTIFSSPTLAELAAAADQGSPGSGRRILHLAGPRDTATTTTLLWPGLGGYPMSLRTLAQQLAQQGHGGLRRADPWTE